MNSLEIKAVEKAVQILSNMKCQYFVVMPDGTTLGELPTDKKTKGSGLPHGTLSGYFKPLLKNVKAGEIVVIPILDYPKNSLASSLAAHLSINWGAGSYTYETVNNELHVLRLL
jgi:hypothetical protein